jgi:hypothetical protein
MDSDEPVWIGLAEVVAGVRAELAAAMIQGAGREPRFELGPITMEFTVELRKEKGIEGGVQVWVLSAGGKGAKAEAHTHHLTVEIRPIMSTGESVKVASEAGSLSRRPNDD